MESQVLHDDRGDEQQNNRLPPLLKINGSFFERNGVSCALKHLNDAEDPKVLEPSGLEMASVRKRGGGGHRDED